MSPYDVTLVLVKPEIYKSIQYPQIIQNPALMTRIDKIRTYTGKAITLFHELE